MQGGSSSQARTVLFPACQGLFRYARNRELGELLTHRSRYCETTAGLIRLWVFFITVRGEARKGDCLAGFITLKKQHPSSMKFKISRTPKIGAAAEPRQSS